MINQGTVISIQVGKPAELPNTISRSASVTSCESAIVKQPVSGRIWVDKINLEGDQQADTKHHGGPDKAVLAYTARHYDKWRMEYPDHEWNYGGFGENLTISGFDEHSVCIGDTFSIGEVILQVSQPRQPCHKLAWRHAMKNLPKIVLDNDRSGWYFRVLQEGYLEAGQPVEFIERRCPDFTAARVQYLLRHAGEHWDEVEQLANNPWLAADHRKFFQECIEKHKPKSRMERVKAKIKSLLK
jgi:MOSC domain-containing protein YiiM